MLGGKGRLWPHESGTIWAFSPALFFVKLANLTTSNIGQLCDQNTVKQREKHQTWHFLDLNLLFVVFGVSIGRIRPRKHCVFKGLRPNIRQNCGKKTPKGQTTPISRVDRWRLLCKKHNRTIPTTPYMESFRTDLFIHFSSKQ